DTSYRKSDDPRGTVIAQAPAAGDFRAEQTSVHVYLSTGPKPVPLPELRGKTQADATQALQSQFAVQIVEASSETVPKGQVIKSNPVGSAPLDSTVQLVVSTGPPLVVVPEASGKSYD